jgi:hypothetical protein
MLSGRFKWLETRAGAQANEAPTKMSSSHDDNNPGWQLQGAVILMSSDSNFVDDSFKHNETSRPKPTIKIKRINCTNPNLTNNGLKEISDEINALQRAVCRLTYLVSKSLEEQHYAAILKRESWC